MKYNRLNTQPHAHCGKPIFRILLLALVLLPSTLLHGQEALSVTGRVSDASSGEPLPFVNVALMRTHDTIFMRGATTDAQGRFRIADVAPGQYLLQASFVGYSSYLERLDVLEKLENLDIKLRPGTTLQAVEVTAEKPLYLMDGEKNLYNTSEDVSVQGGTLSDALQNAPGVEVDAEGNITLRGVSSVEIWLNGRPSHMNEEALKQYIKTMPAGAVERIEVITNPSARYSTTGGVINIVTNQRVTRNELLCLGLRGRTMPSISPWLSYVYANEKFDINFYLNADYTSHPQEADGTSTLFNAGGDTSRLQSYDSRTSSKNWGGYAGLNLNWAIDSLTNLAAWAGIYPGWASTDETLHQRHIEYPSLQNLGYDYSHSGDGSYWGGYVGAWLEHRFDTAGRKLSLALNGSTWNMGGTSEGTRRYLDPALGALTRRTDQQDRHPSASLSLDYTHPFAHGFELEAGLEASTSHDSERNWLDSLSSAGAYISENLRSAKGSDRSNGLAAYLTLQKRFGRFTAKVGIRGEQTWAHGEWNYRDGSGRVEVDTSFFGLVPSLHLSYTTEDFQSYSLSYTRRFALPDASQLSPFVNYDDYSFTTGNPALLRSYTHNLEAAWNKYIAGFGNVGLNAYFRANTDEVGTMALAGYAPAYFPPTQLVNYTKPVNIGSSHTEGLEANLTIRLSAMFNVRLNASLFNYGYDYDGHSDNKVSWSARVNLWAKLWNRLEVFANARYSSPRLGLYSVSVANKGIDFGCSTDLLDRRLSLFFNVNDIFGMAEWGENSTAPQYQTTGSQRYDSRFVSLGITWRIGKMELESKARQGANDNSSPQM